MKFVQAFITAVFALSLAACGGGSTDDDAEPSLDQGFVVVEDATAPGPNANQGFVVVEDATAPAPSVAAGKRHPRSTTSNFVVVED